MKPQHGPLLTRLIHDTSGNTLAIAAASTFAIMGVVGGAVDISRTYMVESRLQQACDAGALAARKNMSGETLSTADKDLGYSYFDFNFPDGSYDAELISRTYSQQINDAGTPQAIVNGEVVAEVPTTIMRIFGNETVDLTVTCASKMDVTNADVAMVLDVTGSMTTDMQIDADDDDEEDRISALRRAVKAFYDALGPGRAGGDLSKGRIRYGFVPYGTVVNVGYLLTHNQMVSSHDYISRTATSTTQYGWNTTGSESTPTAYTAWTPTTPSAADLAEMQVSSNFTGGWGTGTVGTGSGNYAYSPLDGGSSINLARTISGATSANCETNNNTYASGLRAVGRVSFGTASETTSDVAPIHPASTRTRNYTNSRQNNVIGFRYRWFKVSGTNACRLESATGNNTSRWGQTQGRTSTRNVSWTTYTGISYVYGTRTLDVSAIKNVDGINWNSSVSVPALNRTGSVSYYDDVRLSGSNSYTDDVPSGGSISAGSSTWRGCVEERQMDPTITAATSITSIPVNAFDLNTNLPSTNDATRWRPYLWSVVYEPNASNPDPNSDECPAPALMLQEIGDYDDTVITSPYPTLFDAASGGASSYYYPYSATASLNTQTIQNYINRITLVDGTIHDAGFIWGLHLVSGEGMFAADNPDRFNGQLVSRHIVFMTDGEMNPGEERYVFSGVNQYDGRMAPTSTTNAGAIIINNRRLRILCEEAKDQGITVWVVAITDGTPQDYSDLEGCASSTGHYKSAETSNELVATFTTIAQSIGGLRISQ